MAVFTLKKENIFSLFYGSRENTSPVPFFWKSENIDFSITKKNPYCIAYCEVWNTYYVVDVITTAA